RHTRGGRSRRSGSDRRGAGGAPPFARARAPARGPGVVRSEEAHPRAALGLRKREEELGLVARGEAQEEVLRLGALERAEALDAIRGNEEGPRFLEVRRRERFLELGFRA